MSVFRIPPAQGLTPLPVATTTGVKVTFPTNTLAIWIRPDGDDIVIRLGGSGIAAGDAGTTGADLKIPDGEGFPLSNEGGYTHASVKALTGTADLWIVPMAEGRS